MATTTEITKPAASVQIGVWKIALGVFLGNLMFAALAGILYAMDKL